MDPTFFRKYADIITETSAPLPPTKEAKILHNLVYKITDLGGGDDGYEWLDRLQGPLGAAWRGFFDDANAQNSEMKFYNWILQHMPHQVITQLASEVKGIYNDAKFDILY